MKNKVGSPSIKSRRQMRTQVNTTQRKNKAKKSTKNQVKTICKEDSWWVIVSRFGYHLLTIETYVQDPWFHAETQKKRDFSQEMTILKCSSASFNPPCVSVWHVQVCRSHMETSPPSPSSSNFLTTRVPSSIEERLWLMTTVGQFLLLKRTFGSGSNFFLKLWKNVWF